MEKKEKRIYETPRLTTVTFRAERGYAVSSAIWNAVSNLFEYNNSNPNVTQYDEDDTWSSYSWN